MKGAHYIDLGPWPPGLFVIADPEVYAKFTRQKCGDDVDKCPPFPKRNGGCCQKMESDSDCIFLITVGEHEGQIELAAILAHEATHAMRWVFEHIGEHTPGLEAQAYLVEHIVRLGMKALAS